MRERDGCGNGTGTVATSAGSVVPSEPEAVVTSALPEALAEWLALLRAAVHRVVRSVLSVAVRPVSCV